MIVFSNDEIKSFENFLINSINFNPLILMENAASKLYYYLIKNKKNLLKNILIICGHGNNGGDGLALARKLIINNIKYGINQKIFNSLYILILNHDKYSNENIYQQNIINKFNKNYLKKFGIHILYFNNDEDLKYIVENINEITLFIDAILGFGTENELKYPFNKIIMYLNNFKTSKNIFTISIDVPSGIAENYDNISIKSDLVLCLAFYKLSLFLPFNRKKYEKIKLIDIEFPHNELINYTNLNKNNKNYLKSISKIYYVNKNFINYFIINKLKNIRSPFSNKGNFGKVYVFSSLLNTLGASIFSCLTSYSLGAGLTYLFIKDDFHNSSIKTTFPQIITYTYNKNLTYQTLENGNCFVIGPGFGDEKELLIKIFKTLLELKKDNLNGITKKFIILDADALNLISTDDKLKELMFCLSNLFSIIITPHLKEFSKFTGIEISNIIKNQLNILVDYSTKYNISILLKSFQSFAIIREDYNEFNNDNFENKINSKKYNTFLINKGCNSGLAKGGTGDLVAGAISAFLAQELNIFESVALVLYLFDNIEKYEKNYNISKFSYDYTFIINCLKKELYKLLGN
ncbi:MAG: NAD(P)H-hydrate epimerase [Spirochaetes bacterium]|nr:NAD(P)H-hydrate epimerase [Spirochaetota bacterium]